MQTVCLIHQNDGTDVRVGKMCRTLSRSAAIARTVYLGWVRDDSSHVAELGETESRLFRRISRNAFGALLARLGFVAWVLAHIIRIKPDAVVAVNEEMCFPVLLLRPFMRFRLITDIQDPLADRVVKGPLHFLFRLVQSAARRGADYIWVTDDKRFARLEAPARTKAAVIPNFPNRPQFDIMKSAYDGPDQALRIAVIGSLHTNRGIGILREALEQAGPVQLELAGWYTDRASEALGEQAYSRFHGVLGMQDALRLIASCDLVFCFYNPEIENNIHASPNKVYEAVCMGKRCIINSESIISDWVTENGFGYACAYADSAALAAILRKAAGELAAHRAAEPRLVAYAEGRLYWEAHEATLLRMGP